MHTPPARPTGRGWAYLGALLGGGVSLAANIAHSYVPPPGTPTGWTPETGAVISATFWPLAVFVAVEILVRIPWPDGRRWLTARYLGVLPVAAVAAAVSYRHLSALLAHYGEDTLTALIGPLAIDGLMVMASAALVATGPTTAALPRPAHTGQTSGGPTGTRPGNATAARRQASLDTHPTGTRTGDPATARRQGSLDTRPASVPRPGPVSAPARANGHAIGTGVVR